MGKIKINKKIITIGIPITHLKSIAMLLDGKIASYKNEFISKAIDEFIEELNQLIIKIGCDEGKITGFTVYINKKTIDKLDNLKFLFSNSRSAVISNAVLYKIDKEIKKKEKEALRKYLEPALKNPIYNTYKIVGKGDDS